VDLAEKEFQAAANADPKDPVGKLRLADFYLQQHKIEDAKRVLIDLTARFPDYLPAWLRTAEVAIAEKKLDEAMKALDAVFDKSPEDRTALMLKGQIQLAQNDTNNALQTYQRVIKNNPKFGPARVQLARAELQAGDTEQAKAQLRRALEATPDYADALFLLSDVNIRSGASAVAIEDLSKYVAKFPKAARAYELLGAAYLRQHQAAQASEAYRKRVALAPDDPRGQYLLATSLRAEGKTQEARRLLEDILTKAPSAVDPLGQLVLMDFAEKKPDAALERVKRQIQKAPDTAALYFVLGGVYQRRGELDLAAQAHKKALSLDPNGFGSYKDLAQICIAQGKTADGLAMLAKARELRPKDATIPILTGMVQQQQGDFAKAQASYEEAWQLDPKSAVAANNLAWILAHKTGDQEKALALAQEAKELAPEDPSVSDTLGWILYQRGIYQRAATLLKDASEKLPQNAEIRYHYAMALLKTGDESGARHELTQALAGSPTFDGVEEARAALGRMH
jgi:putative PEP-CTERM system TPR-repeat lipoprotein